MATPNVSVTNDEQIKRHLLWKKVKDPNSSEETKIKRTPYQSNSLNKTGVPMIPPDLLGGSSNDVTENKIVRKLRLNPLVPIGMGLTVACLIGMFKASLNSQLLKSQYYMRGRIAAQFFTVCALVGGAIYGLDSRVSKPKTVPNEPDTITKTLQRMNN